MKLYDKVLVVGSGIIRQLTGGLAKKAGASYLAMAKRNDRKLELAKKIGYFDDYFDKNIGGVCSGWASFMEEYDFEGKTIVPLCSHGGGRFGQSLTAIAKLAPDADIGEGLAVNYSGVHPCLRMSAHGWKQIMWIKNRRIRL